MKKYSQYPLFIKGPYRLYALAVIDGIHKLRRTGWVDRGVEKPETVGEHTEDMIKMANQIFPGVLGLVRMLKIHDWLEFIKWLGDRRTDKYCPLDHRYTLEEKKEAELDAMTEVCLKLGPFGKSIFKLWLEYEEGITWRAQIANQLDKLQVDIKAMEYQMAGQPVIASQFIELNRHRITIPIFKSMLEEAELRLKKYLQTKTN